MGRQWWLFPRWTEEYQKGVDQYIERKFKTEAQGEEINCPCKLCHSRNWFHKSVVKEHMISKGVVELPEEEEDEAENIEIMDFRESHFDDKIDNLLNDTFRDGSNEDAKLFYNLVKEGQEELYSGCKNFSNLSFIIRLFIYKRDHRLSNSAMNELLQILKDMLPEAKLPKSFNEARRTMKALGLDYIKIDACPNDCMLYWEENADATSCHTCKASRWKSEKKDENTGKVRRISAKILRYFPIKKRLQRLFMAPEIANYLKWHAKQRLKDGLLRHPADGEDWKKFDLIYPKFAEDPRNVRLGLASDGFNPFSTMSSVYSTWPVILTNYNLPPWLCTKSDFLMLALLIPGPSSPGNAIDVYLQPLVKDLKDLWDIGIETYDSSSKEVFNLQAALVSTTSDFPAYAMLSGWSTKGKFACPCCHYETCSQWLTYSRKYCYMGHERFKIENLPYECNKGSKPVRLTGTEVCTLLADFDNKFGKEIPKNRRDDNEDACCPWKKKSIFFELPYWMHISCRHSLDVMHIEKNICDSVLGTLLDMQGKTKDHIKARLDLGVLGMMPKLQPHTSEGGEQVEMPKSDFWMTLEEKRLFCKVIKGAKLPKEYGSNIARSVHVKEKKIVGYKSHDAHLLMHYLLPVAASTTLHKDVAIPLVRLSNFFRGICSKVVDPSYLDFLQSEITEILCDFEKIFPPAFFDIMVHLPIHLVEEIKLGGPSYLRWMYPIERYLQTLKAYVRNKCRPEGSMAEAYLADECATFCSLYLHPEAEKRVDEPDVSLEVFKKKGFPVFGKGKRKKSGKDYEIELIKWSQAHRYVLFNCNDEEVEKYICEHKELVSNQRKRKWDSSLSHSKDFNVWFKEKIESELYQGNHVHDYIKWLSYGPSTIAKRYSGYYINGYTFHTMNRDANYASQNSGVSLTALTTSFASSRDQNPIMGDVIYFGSIEEIIEISYLDHSSVILFGCIWFHVEQDKYGLTRVDRNKHIYANEPFILASQAHQVFYVEDPKSKGLSYAVQNLKRDRFEDRNEKGYADQNLNAHFRELLG